LSPCCRRAAIKRHALRVIPVACVDVAVMKDGSLLISDDFAGAIYRVTYTAP